MESSARIIDKVASLSSDNVRFKNQARDEPTLTYDEKVETLSKLLNTPSNFLFRFGMYLDFADLEYFDQFSSDLDVAYHLRDLRNQLNSDKMRVVVRNRRFASLDTLTSSGYFDGDLMRQRDPLLFEELVEKYMTTDEKLEMQRRKELRDRAEERSREQPHPFADILMESLIEKPEVDAYRERQREKEQCQVEEEEDEGMTDEEEEGDTTGRMEVNGANLSSADESDLSKITLDEEGRTLLREEFRHIMQERFLEGKDSEFLDYKAIDHNDTLDRSKEFLHDEEDRYFDDEEPS